MRKLPNFALVVVVGLFLPSSLALANGPEIGSELDEILKRSQTNFFTKPNSPVKGDDVKLYVQISNEGHPLHDVWVDVLISKVGGKGLGDLVKCNEKNNGLYVGPYKFEKEGTYNVEVSANYILLGKYQVTVENN